MSDAAGSSIRMADFDYDLPAELIAQVPLADRSASRLMVVDRSRTSISHRQFVDFPGMLSAGDLLVVNDSRVIPARLVGRRQSGGEAEFLLLREVEPKRWLVLMRPARRLHPGERVAIAGREGATPTVTHATLIEKVENGQGIIELDASLADNLGAYGQVPLPPYIQSRLEDDERYQTVYSRAAGSAAAPTAGLHFTPEILTQLEMQGVNVARVTLHVGLDTFRPVTAEYAEDHVIHQEWFEVTAATARQVAITREKGGRVIAVGTTAARTLESLGKLDTSGERSVSGMTGIYITPGYEWQVVDAMITNFHLPKSTLLLMMSSFAGRDLLFEAYRQAIDERYRFFSFGDAMFVT